MALMGSEVVNSSLTRKRRKKKKRSRGIFESILIIFLRFI
jgi:hypothetical protein